ncbi:MAG: ABC transporter permease [Gemmatimonas sp.]
MSTPTPGADVSQSTVIFAEKRRVSTFGILAELWGARELVMQFTMRDITIRYAQAVMGFAWALLMPMLIVAAGLIFRLAFTNASGTAGQTSSIASLLVKSLPWAFFSAAISLATQSILASANLMGKVKFPREALPFASVLAQSLDLLVGAVLIAIVLVVLGTPLSWSVLWVPLLVVLLILFTIGWGLLLSCANLFYRDVKYIVQVCLNFGVFATPVFFEPQMLGPKYGAIMLKLPLSPFIQGLDLAAVRGHNLLHPLALPASNGTMVTVWSPWMLVYALVLTLVTLWTGLRVFRRASALFAEMA